MPVIAGALSSLNAAEEVGRNHGDDFYLGLVYRAISDVYAESYMNDKAISYMGLAYDKFLAADKRRYADWAMLDIANYQSLNRNFAVGDSLFNRVFLLAKETGDSTLLMQAYRRYVWSLMDRSDSMNLVVDMLEAVGRHNLLSATDKGRLAYAYLLSGRQDESEKMIREEESDEVSPLDRDRLAFSRYKIEEFKGNYPEAIKKLHQSFSAEDSLFNVILEQSVESSQKDYYRDKSELLRGKVRSRNLAIVAIVLLLLALIRGFVEQVRIRKMEKYNLMDDIAQLRNELAAMSDQVDDKSRLVSELMNEKFRVLNNLSDAYLYNGKALKPDEKVFSQVEEELYAFKEDKSFSELESILDMSNDNIMARARREIELKEHDYQFLCYFFSGLSNSAIRLLTSESKDNIYKKRSRLITKIKSSGSKDTDFFLKYL